MHRIMRWINCTKESS